MAITSLIKVALIALVIIYLHTLWAKYRISQWALRNNCRITKCQLRLFNIGPFSYFGTSGGQYIFRIEAISFDGKTRTGYARAGGFFLGLLRSRVEVRWDKNPLEELLSTGAINPPR